MNETGITTVQETGRIVASKSQKRIGGATSGEIDKTTTIICCMNATGGYVPTCLFLLGQRMASTLKDNA